MRRDNASVDRRTYLKLTGAGGVAMMTAGCLSDLTGGGDSQEIVAGTAVGFPPFEIRNDQGEIDGFDIELLEAIVDETDYELTDWRNFDFKSLVPSLTSDEIDVIAAAMTITEEREQTISFTDPYYSADQGVLVRSGGDFQPSSLGDLAGRTLGAQKGTTGESVAQDEVEDSTYRGYDSYVLAVQDLQNRNLDAVVLDQPVAQSFEANQNVEIAFVYETGEEYGFGVRKNDDDLREALNDGLATVQDDGTFQDLTTKWFGEE
ncbi:MAG TPA: transporter substrate-binding domain-containing protein [Natrialbaceae archaeon]|nr:transporter substrate-binding domain-containing protein [Natrialbaceae archaeon]